MSEAVFTFGQVDIRSDLHPQDEQRLDRGQLITAPLQDPSGVSVQTLIDCPPDRLFGLLTEYPVLPRHIFGLKRAELLREKNGVASIRFTMKLPFPVGQIAWTNLVVAAQRGRTFTIEWTLLDGDLRRNDGRLVLMPHRGMESVTFARYEVRVQTRSRLPDSAQQLATRWLLPKIVNRLRRIAENR